MNIILIRTSSKDQNPRLQLKNIVEIFNPKEYEVLEEQQSAYKSNIKREIMKELIRLVKKGVINNIYIWDLDRLFRNRKKLVTFLELCRINQTKIHSCNQQWLTTIHQIPEPFNEIVYDLMTNLLGWIAEDESTKRGKRIQNAVRKKDGKPTVSYKGNKWGRKGMSSQAKKRLFQMREEGKSIREIANEFYYYDSNRNKKRVSKSCVHKILSLKP